MHTNFMRPARPSKTTKQCHASTQLTAVFPLPGMLSREHLRRLVAAMVD